MSTQVLVMVGGPEHGKIRAIPEGYTSWRMLRLRAFKLAWAPPESADDLTEIERDTLVYDVAKVYTIMPARTDWQMFPVLAYVRDASLLADALLQAWAAGWSPPDDTSEVWLNPWQPWNPDGWKP